MHSSPKLRLLSFTLAAIALTVTVTSCTKSPKDLASSHLKLVQSGKAGEAQKQYCSPSDSLRLHSVQSFEVTSTKEGNRNGRDFTEVVANVQTTQTRLVNLKTTPITQVTIEIWNSDSFYDYAVASTAEINALGDRTTSLTGVASPEIKTPERSDINQSKECVFLPFDQFQDE